MEQLSTLTYELVAIDCPVPAAREGTAGYRRVGRYPTYRSALQARVEDVLAVLMANDGRRVRAEHLVIGPGVAGPATVSGCCTDLGAELSPGRLEPADIERTRAWLMQAHGLE